MQMQEKTASMARLVNSLLRGRAQPSARHEAAAALSDVRAFVRACRPAPQGQAGGTETARHGEERTSGGDGGNTPRPAPPGGTLLKLAQVGWILIGCELGGG